MVSLLPYLQKNDTFFSVSDMHFGAKEALNEYF